MKETWSDDSDFSSSDDKDHVADMCLMAIKSDNDVLFLDDESDLSYDEPHDAFESLYDGFKKLGHKYSSLKNNYACLLVEKDALEKKTCISIDRNKVNQLDEKNKALKEKVGQVEYHTSKVHTRF
jgi:hypothetical protein